MARSSVICVCHTAMAFVTFNTLPVCGEVGIVTTWAQDKLTGYASQPSAAAVSKCHVIYPLNFLKF